MRCRYPFLTNKLTPLLGLVFLLGACVQTTAQVPSRVANTNLQKLQQQQQLHTTQIESLQRQVKQLQQQLIDKNIISAQNHENSTKLSRPTNTKPAELAINYSYEQNEAAGIAASAASYLAAFSHLAASRPVAAEAGFETFLSNFPNHLYAPNARYWLASAQLSQGHSKRAKANLQQLATNPRAKAKVPAALLLLAQIYRQEGLSIQADNVLEQLRNHYPESQEAQQFYRSTEPTD
ncbi:MAG: tetratricopeptide repeat protein [Desulfuromonadales bacterium]|nr:tetratricopeptide repeat protein [Desulfuromonadales bacterium]